MTRGSEVSQACVPVFVLLLCGLCPAQDRMEVTPEPTSANLPANLPSQPIGPNDLLSVFVYRAPELSRSVRVDPDGYIRLLMLGEPLKAEGLLPMDVEREIAAALRTEGILVKPNVTVAVAEYHSRPISVAGAVRNTLTFQAAGPVTLLEALSKAGGLEKEAGSEILVTIPGPSGSAAESTVRRISVKSLINAADSSSNLVLKGGEEIRVPEGGRIFVVGNVHKPGAFTTEDAPDATVLKAVAIAEGLEPFSAKLAFIYRPLPDGSKQEIPIELSRILDRKAADVRLLADDILYVPDNKGRKMTALALERIVSFGTTAGATALIYGR